MRLRKLFRVLKQPNVERRHLPVSNLNLDGPAARPVNVYDNPAFRYPGSGD
jgi:hypothetical protein